jgi:hypothetical protein
MQEREAFPFVVGGVSAGIFLLQVILATGSDEEHHFTALRLLEAAVTFALGATAALVLSRTGPLVRGDSAALKAANICSLIVVTNVAAYLVYLRDRESLIGALASSLGVIAALILSAVTMYDLKLAKARGGQMERPLQRNHASPWCADCIGRRHSDLLGTKPHLHSRSRRCF